jgi:hypothetical protein
MNDQFDQVPYPGAPRWAKIFGGTLIALLVLLLAAAIVGGEHGPGRHALSTHGPSAQPEASR